jgi:energy-coupling factor transporter ATP-binding protein EcfA2
MISYGPKVIKEYFTLDNIEVIVSSRLKDVKSEKSGPSVLVLGEESSGKSTFVNHFNILE